VVVSQSAPFDAGLLQSLPYRAHLVNRAHFKGEVMYPLRKAADFRQIGRQPGVGYVLEGGVRRLGDRPNPDIQPRW
jgi:hypothetical protein